MTTEPIPQSHSDATAVIAGSIAAQRMCLIALMAIVEKHITRQPDLFATVLKPQFDRLAEKHDPVSRAIQDELQQLVQQAGLAK